MTRSVRDVLLGADPRIAMRRRASARLARICEDALGTAHPDEVVVIRSEAGDVRWWTWAAFRANFALTATLADLADPRQHPEEELVRLRTDIGPRERKTATADACARLCLPEIDDDALTGLKFNTALPPRLAEATLASRLADLSAANAVLREPVRFTRL